MRQSKYQIRIGDILYEASFTYRKVIEWKITDICVEDYLGGAKTIFTVMDLSCRGSGRSTKYLSDVLSWYNTREEAEAELKRKLDKCPMWRDVKLEASE